MGGDRLCMKGLSMKTPTKSKDQPKAAEKNTPNSLDEQETPVPTERPVQDKVAPIAYQHYPNLNPAVGDLGPPPASEGEDLAKKQDSAVDSND